MNDTQIIDVLKNAPTGNLCNAHHSVKAMSADIKPLMDGIKIAGPAKTVKLTPGDNAAIHYAVHTANPGDILVVDCGGNKTHGPFGDILAQCCINKGIGGLVIDGTIRDIHDIRQMGFPVFCLGGNPTATQKKQRGIIDQTVSCGNITLSSGDYIVGDDDGVVVIDQKHIDIVVKQVENVMKNEEIIKKRLADGETTYEIFNLENLYLGELK